MRCPGLSPARRSTWVDRRRRRLGFAWYVSPTIRKTYTRNSSRMKTYSPKASEITRRWWVVDADGQILGRLASAVAYRLRGKDKPMFATHMDTGDCVVVVNAAKVRVTGRKLEQKRYYRHSGYPGGLKTST